MGLSNSKYTPSRPTCYHEEFCRRWLNGISVRRKNGPFKVMHKIVVETDTRIDWISMTSIVTTCFYCAISDIYSEILGESCKLSFVYLMLPLTRIHWNFITHTTRTLELPGRKSLLKFDENFGNGRLLIQVDHRQG